MPIGNIIVLVGIVTAFAAFAGSLAWGQWQTRNE